MGSDRFMEERDACPSRLAAANARIGELETESRQLLSLVEACRNLRRILEDTADGTYSNLNPTKEAIRAIMAALRGLGG